MSYPELLEHHRAAKEGMFNAKTDHEHAVWAVIYRWASEELKKLTARTVSRAQKLSGESF